MENDRHDGINSISYLHGLVWVDFLELLQEEIVMDYNSFLIIIFYYNRPQMVRDALHSIKEMDTRGIDYEIAFIDDGSPRPGKPVVEKLLKDQLSKIRFFNSGDERNIVGRFANQALKETSAKIAIMLCDDDALFPDYLVNLREFFNNNPQIDSCYSKVKIYNPIWEDFRCATRVNVFFNHREGPITTARVVDASQVAWKTNLSKTKGVLFDEYRIRNLDESLYDNLDRAVGYTYPSGFYSQFKGVHNSQLGLRSDNQSRSGIAIDREELRENSTLQEVNELITQYNIEGRLKEYARLKKLVKRYPNLT